VEKPRLRSSSASVRVSVFSAKPARHGRRDRTAAGR
jgi:hypothetical protein